MQANDVLIQIIDNGIGIATDALPRIFQMFSQVKTTQDRSDGGLGIGLALAKGLVELHRRTHRGGERRTGPRQRICRASADRNGCSQWMKTVSAALPEQGKFVGRRVLIADDNHDSADSLAMLLRMEGHEVAVVHDGPGALEAVGNFAPDIALLDIGMPGLNGYEVAQKIRQASPSSPLRLVAVTGWGQHSDKARASASGFDHHFTKPVEPQQLMALLRD